MNEEICARCLSSVSELYESPCGYDPREAQNAIGQFHCPACGTMVMAGMPHLRICKKCMDELKEREE